MRSKRWNQKGKVIIMSETTDEPLTLAGQMAGICWGSNTSDHTKNFQRGLDCLKSGHGRVLEYPQIYMILDGWSARVIREFTRHIGGAPTYLQASTRYVNYNNFNYYTPEAIENDPIAKAIYDSTMDSIAEGIKMLEELCKIKREDSANLLPLGMETKIVFRTNLRMLVDMAKVRKCTRAYHEFRDLFKAIEEALCIYSDEWKYLIEEEHIFKSKCEIMGYCDETYSCGRFPKKEDINA